VAAARTCATLRFLIFVFVSFVWPGDIGHGTETGAGTGNKGTRVEGTALVSN